MKKLHKTDDPAFGRVVEQQRRASLTSGARMAAEIWRVEQSESMRSGGVVLVFGGEVYGWKNELRDPQHERPGVAAVDVAGNVWIATGGNDYDGAQRWETDDEMLDAEYPAQVRKP